MTRRLFIFDDPDRFVAGTVGEPGDRTFYLQARKGGAVVSGGRYFVQPTCLHAPDVYAGIGEQRSSGMLKDFFKDRR